MYCGLSSVLSRKRQVYVASEQLSESSNGDDRNVNLTLINFYFFCCIVCGEYKSGTKGVFNNFEINNEIDQLNKRNISEPTLCIYKFIANKNEKVEIRFDNFDIKSSAPEYVFKNFQIYFYFKILFFLSQMFSRIR